MTHCSILFLAFLLREETPGSSPSSGEGAENEALQESLQHFTEHHENISLYLKSRYAPCAMLYAIFDKWREPQDRKVSAEASAQAGEDRDGNKNTQR